MINYRGPRGTIPTYSFADLVEGKLDPALFTDRIVLIGASFIGISDTYPGPFGNTPMPGTERLANIVETILSARFHRENPPPWPWIVIGSVALLAVATGIAAARASDAGARCSAARCRCSAGPAARSWPSCTGCGCRLVDAVDGAGRGAAAVLLFRYGFVDRQRRWVQSGVPAISRPGSGRGAGGRTRSACSSAARPGC